MDQLCSGQLKLAMNASLDEKDALRKAERIRAAAVDSFNWIDSNEVIRRGLHARSRPPKLEMILEGSTVYVHQPPPHRRGQPRRLQDHVSWDGPGLVVCVERQENVTNRIWVRIRGKVRSFPLEKVRMATPDEMLGSRFVVSVLDQMADEIRMGKMALEERPAERAPVGNRRPAIEEEKSDEDMPEASQRPDPYQRLDEDRARQLRRMEAVNDVPECMRSSLSSASSGPALVRPLQTEERNRMLVEDDDEMETDNEEGNKDEPMEPSGMRFQQKQKLFEDFSKRKERPSTLTEASLRSGPARATQNVQNIRKLIQKSRQTPAMQKARRERMDRQEAASVVLWTEACEKDEFEKCWEVACNEWEMQEAFWTQPEPRLWAQVEIQEKVKVQQHEHQQAAAGAGVAKKYDRQPVSGVGKVVTGKARLEYNWGQLSMAWQAAFKEPLIKAIKIYFDHNALEGVPKDKVIDPKRILSSRFVLTNKGGNDLENAVLKARLVLGGHRDPDAGKFPTLAPTAAALAHNLINFVSVQMGWIVKYEDVSSAFLQGKRLPPEREVYVRIPKGYPSFIEQFIVEQLGADMREDLMKMTKGGFGLPESPRLWYLEYKETLEHCGVRELHLLPGVFAAHHPDGTLRALACIHVDDTRYCGDPSSEEIWTKVHQCLNFGEVRRATDGWVKFCGRWERQDPDTLEFEYSMDEYPKGIQKLTNLETYKLDPKEVIADEDKLVKGEITAEEYTRDSKKSKKAHVGLTSEQRLTMSSVLGQLNWMARQGRFDLAYGVSHVQQLLAREPSEALEFLNKVIYRAKQPMTQVVRRLKDWKNLVVVSASDAAYGAQPGGYSQGGLLIGLADAEILEGEGRIVVVEAMSMKIQRVVRCSMSAEVSMAATSFEHGDFIRAALSEMIHGHFVLRDWKLWANRWRHFLVIDAKTGFDVLTNESQTSDRKIQIDLAVLKQALMEDQANAFAKWVPGHHMVSDGLTKWFGNKALQKALTDGLWSLKDTDEALGLRQTAADMRRKLRKSQRTDKGGDV
eukprot:s254_g18.t1